MFARELAKRIRGSGVTACSLHPGTVYTEITRYFFSGWLIFLKVCSIYHAREDKGIIILLFWRKL
jgi:NAD(P)-dependent dehydrogenase (short-subunit alcohol dehydrogenase family)